MKRAPRLLLTAIAAAVLTCPIVFLPAPASAQSAPIELEGTDAPPAAIPRTAEGRPDFGGYWEVAFLTGTGRFQGATKLVVSEEEAKKLTSAFIAMSNSPGFGHAVDPDFFLGEVDSLLKVKGEIRTSLITTPADGVQHYTPEGAKLEADYKKRRDGVPNDPEERPLFERCLVGVGSAPLTPILGRLVRQVVQTPDHVVVSTDGNDVRVIGVNAAPRPQAMVSLLGDSVGHWEDDTLVVHTTGISGQIHTQMITRPQSRIIEKFQLISANELFYQFAVEDTAIYAEPFSAEFVMTRTREPVLEYACHEGNYSIVNILQAGRVADQKAKIKKAKARSAAQ